MTKAAGPGPGRFATLTRRARGARPVRPARPARPRPGGQAARMPFVLLVVALLGGGLISLLLLNSALNEGSFQLTKLKKETTALTDEEQALQRDVDAYSAPDALQRRAQEMGLVPGGSPVFIGPDGKVTGTAAEAEPPPAPTPPAPAPPTQPPAGQPQPPASGQPPAPASGQPSGAATASAPAPGGAPQPTQTPGR
ncbi:hypothetical protein [Streptomyces sp. NPDC091371]|uniref:hypothetical protein n=1 Tax=Streptomyces sp. NPDC091371 TaxID=3155303 RepID=UPI003430F396